MNVPVNTLLTQLTTIVENETTDFRYFLEDGGQCMSTAPCNSLFLSKMCSFDLTFYLIAIDQLLTLNVFKAKKVNCLQYLNYVFYII